MRRFIDRLSEDGLLTEIDKEVSPVIQAVSIGREIDNPVLFHNVRGSKVIMNLIPSRNILTRVFGLNREDFLPYLIDRLCRCAEGTSKLPLGQRPTYHWTRIVEDSPTKEVITEPKLSKLPILTHFEKDGGPYITSGVVVTELDGVMNASVHRMMVIDEDKLAVRLVPNRHTYNMHRKAEERGEPLQVGIVIGIDPITLFAVCSRVPEGFEFIYASALKGEEIELFELENGIHVPHAEIAFEGYIHPDVRVKEGPLVDITKTYDLVRDEPLIQLTKMYHRENFIYHAIIPGGREHQILMGVPYEPLIFDAVSRVVQVKNLLLTEGGCCYLHAVIQIVKDREKDGRKAIFSAFSAHHSLKHVVIVDDDIDPFDPKDVEFAIATRVRGDRDIIIVPNVRGSTTDPSSKNGIGTKVGIDATKVISEAERFERIWR